MKENKVAGLYSYASSAVLGSAMTLNYGTFCLMATSNSVRGLFRGLSRSSVYLHRTTEAVKERI